MLQVLEQALAVGSQLHQDRAAGQGSIFDLDGSADAATERPAHHPAIPADEFERKDLLALEKEAIGLYVSEHPLHGLADQLRRRTDCPLSELDSRRDGEVVTVAGMVGSVRALTTRKGDPMAFLRLDDLSGSSEVVVFSSVYADARELVVEDRVLLVKGRVDHKDGEVKLIALELSELELQHGPRTVRLRVDARRADARAIRELAEVVQEFPGESPVVVALETTAGPRTFRLGPGFCVRPEPDFFAEVRRLLGAAAVA
jgi:DNA polymerase-3 subunit alpha